MSPGTKPLPKPMLTQIYVTNDANRPQLVKVWAKWPPFYRQNIQRHFLMKKFVFGWSFLKVFFSPKSPAVGELAFGSGNGLAPKRPFITWTNSDQCVWCHLAPLCRNGLTKTEIYYYLVYHHVDTLSAALVTRGPFSLKWFNFNPRTYK